MSNQIQKVIRDGKVAVLYSPGYGAGWHSWGLPVELVFDPEVVNLVLNDQRDKIASVLEARGIESYFGGARQLEVEWIPENTQFRIDEYDGNESIEYATECDWITA